MAMVGADLGEAIRSEMGFPLPVSSQLLGWGDALVSYLQTGIVTHVAGSVMGTAPSGGGALINGTATNGIISGLTGAAFASAVSGSAGYPGISGELQSYCNEIVDHIQTFGLVEFAPGTITGTCTNSSSSAGGLANGAGSGGLITNLDGTALASAIHSSVGYPGGVSGPLTLFCNALMNYIMANAEVSYASGTVTAICPSGGGSITNGAGANGIIS